MALTSNQENGDGVIRRAWGTRTGTRTAANFTITLGFAPKRIRVINLTDGVVAEHFVDSNLDGGSNAKSLLTQNHDTAQRSYADAGITVSGRTFSVVVATAGLETDDDDVYWEAEA